MVATSWVLSLFALSSVVLASPTAGLSGSDSTGITHSYSEDHEFKRDEGWISLDERDGESLEDILEDEPSNITVRDTGNMHERAVSHRRRGLYTSLKGLFKPLTGPAETVKITWYTGNDLKNPSCWANTKWVPTDQHYIAAVTLKGWSTKPKCFDFLELCNGTKCTFVRIIDTCAGCVTNSKHVDLTKSAFKALVPLDVGVKNVKMRRASQPSEWRSDLWGPKK